MINAKVIKILSNKEFVIDVGHKHGVVPDLKFIIYSEGEEIFNPLDGKYLGKLEILKGTIKAAHIQEEFTICETLMYSTNTINTLRNMQFGVDYQGELKVRNEDITPLPSLNIEVRIGDFVKSI